MKRSKVKDIHGNTVCLGTRVRLLKIADFLRKRLPRDEVEQLDSMVGEVFTVEEIDEYGWPWISKSFPTGDDGCQGHSLALDSDEFEVVSQSET